MNEVYVGEEASSSIINKNVDFGIKKCPVCGVGVFSDMDTCYNCMYKFSEYSFAEEVRPSAVLGCEAAEGDNGCLFNEFLVEFERFLVEFIVNRRVDLK
jgi:hypothetical protein